MSVIVEQLAWAIAGAGIVTAVLVLLVFRRPLLAVQVLLDMLLAAGLLRLNADATWESIAVAAIVIALRQLLRHNLTSGLSRTAAALRPAAVPAHWPTRR